MRVELYNALKQLYMYKYEYSDVTRENVADWAKKVLWFELDEKEIEIAYVYLNEGDEKGNQALSDMITEEFSKMTKEERVDKFLEFLSSGEYEPIMFNAIENKADILDKLGDMTDFGLINSVMNYMSVDVIADYLEGNGPGRMALEDFVCRMGSVPFINELFDKMQSDTNKSIILLHSGLSSIEKNKILPTIENEYLRNQIIRAVSDNTGSFEIGELEENILNYNSHVEALSEMEDESQKAEYIAMLEDYDLRVHFLNDIKLRENRDAIINSMEVEHDPKIKSQVELVQQMLTELFEDTLGEDFDENKRDLMNVVFARTSVSYAELENGVNGRANHLIDTILINSRHERNISRTLSFLIHEYGHLFSQSKFRTTGYNPSHAIEEGAQDLLAEMAINHYLEKHKEIVLDGKKVRMEYPHLSYSGYKSENVWMRTALSTLVDEGKDIEAFSEYLLGDKLKYLELVYGPDYASQVEIDAFGNPDINTSYTALYQLHKEKNCKVDENSVYARRNPLLPAFEIERKVNEYGESVLSGGKYRCSYVAKLILGDKKLYDISREDMEAFSNLYIAQEEFVVAEYDEYSNAKINELTDEDIENHSFEILNVSIPLWKRLQTAGNNMEYVWNQSFSREIDKINEGQSLEESIEKYKKIIPDFLSMLSRTDVDTNVYIMDMVQDLQYAYLGQIEQAINDGKTEDVIKGFTDSKTGKLHTDPQIEELFKKHNVVFESISYNDTVYKAQDILDAAIRANIRFNEVSSMDVVFDRDEDERKQETEEVK